MRKLVTMLLMIAVLAFACATGFATFVAYAGEDVSTVLPNAGELFSSGTSVEIEYADAGGITMTATKAASDTTIAYSTESGAKSVRLDMVEYSIVFNITTFGGAEYTAVEFRFFDIDDTENCAIISLAPKKAADDRHYIVAKATSVKVNESIDSETLKSVEINANITSNLVLAHINGKFYLRQGDAFDKNDLGTEIELPSDPRLSNERKIVFERNEARMNINLKQIDLTNTDSDKDDDIRVVFTLKSMSNTNGVQLFNKGQSTVAPILHTTLIPEPVYNEGGQEIDRVPDENGKMTYEYYASYPHTKSYEFPFYLISFSNQPLNGNNQTNFSIERWETKQDGYELVTTINSNSSFDLAEEGSKYRMSFYTDIEKEVHVLYLDAVTKTNTAKFNNAALEEYLEGEGGIFETHSALKSSVIYTEQGVDIPTLKDSSSVPLAKLFYFSVADDEEVVDEYDGKVIEPFESYDTVRSITIYLGYKKQDSTSDWTFTTSFSMTSTTLTEGTWVFCYEVRDAASSSSSTNTSRSKYTFTRSVVDNSPPTITTSSDTVKAYINEIFTVSMPSASDKGGSGISGSVSVKMYKCKVAGERSASDEVIALSKNDQHLFIEEDRSSGSSYTYYLEFNVTDKAGNRAETKYVTISVVDRPPESDDFTPSVLFYILIGLAVVLALFIIIVMFVPEKREETEHSFSKTVDDKAQNGKLKKGKK